MPLPDWPAAVPHAALAAVVKCTSKTFFPEALLAIVPDTVQPAALEPEIAPVAPIDKLKVVTPSRAVPTQDPVISARLAGVL
ncbi:MAG: hypothetical protein CO065_07395 [Comamonadaceae bacterium CG_4_9_14_0_8_um_filter_57_21]|nr:MAG: hypothetical protein CO065_07395 [Comamonadaceae bacterium CG_4_9_14_0_8_um_filter_57_21]